MKTARKLNIFLAKMSKKKKKKKKVFQAKVETL